MGVVVKLLRDIDQTGLNSAEHIPFIERSEREKTERAAETSRINQVCIERFSRVWRAQYSKTWVGRTWNRFMFVIGR